MKALALALTAVGLAAGPALTQDITAIHRDGITGHRTVVKHRDVDGDTMRKKIVTANGAGCRNKLVRTAGTLEHGLG